MEWDSLFLQGGWDGKSRIGPEELRSYRELQKAPRVGVKAQGLQGSRAGAAGGAGRLRGGVDGGAVTDGIYAQRIAPGT